ncbi:hypothetical protein B7P43_G16747 [Cryptotermes secundus]|uniref:DUF659 domain-containing protein n=1 Tax=Cryptotermes secundus TaxID=105785 RepID=A0A2J7QIG9_9NEOP|nr:hypothetical protein B7P43_G16747 [Cryptotermes secundus]
MIILIILGDLCEAILAADIPLSKLTNPTLRNFIEKYTQCKVPDESSVRKNYVKQCYELTIESIRDKIQDNFVWVSIDETQDCEGRFIANCIVGSLNKNEQSTPYLLAVEQLETTNSSAVSEFFLETNLSYISAHFSHLPSAISSLEASNSNSTLYQSLSVFKTTVSKLNSVPGRVGEVVNEKVHNILSKNPQYEQICEIEETLAGKRTELPSKRSLTVEQIAAFVHAPLSSCGVERSYYRYKDILRDNRRRLTTENLKHLVTVNCNRREVESSESHWFVKFVKKYVGFVA